MISSLKKARLKIRLYIARLQVIRDNHMKFKAEPYYKSRATPSFYKTNEDPTNGTPDVCLTGFAVITTKLNLFRHPKLVTE
jgi:hypothetical protein